MNIYLAAPLFSEADQAYNTKIRDALEREGNNVFLPQEGCPGPDGIFECCLENIEKCDAVVAVLDGPQADDGTAFEMGYAHARGTPIFGLRTDFRRVGEYGAGINMMFMGSAVAICATLDELIDTLKGLP